MAEYISREELIEEIEEEIEAGNVALDEDVWTNKGLKIALKDIKKQKAADVQPVKRGRWIYDERPAFGNPYGSYMCSECKCIEPHKGNYCPNCGADMRGDTE